MRTGKLILIVGLPGSGKGTLIAYLKQAFPELVFPVSWTTRPRRPHETEGEVYHFASDEEFTHSVEAGEFLEWVTIDTGHKYGTRKADIVEPLNRGAFIVREVEVAGARTLQGLFPGQVVTIFVLADSWEDLKKRMLERAPMSEAEMEARRVRYEAELSFLKEANHVVSNPDGGLEEAKRKLADIVRTIIAE